MTDERQTQTAAPSPTDGETTDRPESEATATATAEPPAEASAEEPATETAQAAEETADQPADEAQATDAKTTDAETADAKAADAETAEGETEETAAAETEVAASDDGAAETEEAQAAEADATDAETADADTAKAAEQEAQEAAEQEAQEAAAAETAKAEEPEAKAAEAAKAEEHAEEQEAKVAAAESGEPQSAAQKDEGDGDAVTEESAEKTAAASAEDSGEAAADGDDGSAAEDDEKAAKPELDDPALKELRKAKEEGTTVQGKVIGWNRGGFHVVIDEITAFCPSSEMELGRPKSPNAYMDREMDFRVVKFQRRGRRVVLSRAELLKKKRDQVLEGLSKGAVVQGIVTSLPDFGAFVDLGGIEGLVHVSELSRQRIKKPTDMLELGQQVEVQVLKIEKGGDRISLSMKALEPNPWDDVAKKYPRGSEFEGKVLRKADFGLFVELEPDVEGLIHVSQFPPGKTIDSDDVQPGNTVQGWVREVEPKRERISLSLREVPEDDPWKTVTERFPEGEIVKGMVESIAPFGVFINLAPGLTGLLPNSETGLPRGTSAARAFHPGQQVEIQVLSIDTRRKRISLGQKGSRVEATKADLQAYKELQKEQEEDAPSGAMAAAFARVKEDLDLPAEEAD